MKIIKIDDSITKILENDSIKYFPNPSYLLKRGNNYYAFVELKNLEHRIDDILISIDQREYRMIKKLKNENNKYTKKKC